MGHDSMADASPFDPYYVWLGIPPEDQPPNHYRLLGINDFESDPNVIANAADRQMSHVKRAAHGPQGTAASKLPSIIRVPIRSRLFAKSSREKMIPPHWLRPRSSVLV